MNGNEKWEEWTRNICNLYDVSDWLILSNLLSKSQSQSNVGYQRLEHEDVGNDSNETKINYQTIKPSFLRVLFHTYGYNFILTGLIKVLYDQSNFLQPIILEFEFISFSTKLKFAVFHLAFS